MINLVEPKKELATRFWGRDYPARRSPCRIEIGLTVVKVEIEVNNSPAEADDVVQIRSSYPAYACKVQCRARVLGTPPSDIHVVLTSPDGRLRFPRPFYDRTKDLQLDRTGVWSSFEISGWDISAAKDDAKIEARLGNSTGPVCCDEDVTVFWFDQAKIDVTAVNPYAIIGNVFVAVGNHAVDFSAEARIRPAGLVCTVPQIADVRIGIVQNASGTRTTTWNTPGIAWNAGVATGTTVTVPTTYRSTDAITIRNDSIPTAAPLYDRPGIALMIDPNSLKPPLGCPGGGIATSRDAPAASFAPSFTIPAIDAGGNVVGTVGWGNFVNVTMNDTFTTWAVKFHIATDEISALRQRTWTLNVDSAGPAGQKATSAPADAAPTFDPITDPPYYNAELINPANTSTAGVGAATTPFIKQ